MADVAAPAAAATEVSTPKKSAAQKKAKIARAKASHLPTAVMVNGAIKNLKERGGSSLQAIKKYISSTYKIDAEKLAPFIKKYIKASVTAGSLVQTKGKGASGSFKLAASGAASGKADSADKKAKKSAGSRSSAGKPKKRSDDAAKKSQVKKSAAKPKKAAGAKKAAAKPKPKSSPKAKKTAKAPTKKPKSPKPKTTKLKAGKAAAKKATPRKK